ncbi:MAG TPA: hypothetical protein PK941_08740 [Paludibacter sp.]|nr:hypothetical protein [Paludibacter sp.]
MNDNCIVKLTRKELYQMVWSKPVTKWSKEFGLSDVGFAKICKKMKVPLPRRGYWAMVQKGLKIPQPPLKPIHDSKQSVIEIRKRTLESVESRSTEESDPLVLFEKLPENKIIVPERLHSPHPLIKTTEALLKSRGVDKYGRIMNHRLSCLNVRVSKVLLPRVLRIMDTITKELEKREMKIFIKGRECPNTTLSIKGEELKICIEEPSGKVEHQKTKSEIEDARRYPSLYGGTTYDYKPSGKLRILIETYTRDAMRKSWRDSESKKIEDRLNEIFIGFINVAEERKQDHLQREKEEKERLERIRLYEEIQRQKAEEEKRINVLLQQVNSWSQSNAIKNFIHHIKTAAIEKYGEIDEESDLGKWLTWANHQAQRLDPTSILINYSGV